MGGGGRAERWTEEAKGQAGSGPRLGSTPTPRIMLSFHPRATLIVREEWLLGDWVLLGSLTAPPPLPKVAPPPSQLVGIGPPGWEGNLSLEMGWRRWGARQGVGRESQEARRTAEERRGVRDGGWQLGHGEPLGEAT